MKTFQTVNPYIYEVYVKHKKHNATPKYIIIKLLKTSDKYKILKAAGGFPGGTVVKNPPANAGDTGLIPGPGRSHMPWSN